MKTPSTEIEDEMRADYSMVSLGPGVRGKHYKEYRAGINVAFLDEDVRSAFPTDDEVNDALRRLIAATESDLTTVK